MKLNQFYVDNLIKEAISEDINYIDVSADYLIPEEQRNDSYFVAKADGVLCGLDIAMRVFTLLDDTFTYTVHKNDGDEVKAGDLIVEFNGKTACLLKGERTALNIIQHMSGIATATNKAVKLCEGTNASVTDTRKTLPGLRALQKYAVVCGGGKNHRYNLSDGAMLKDNHIDAGGGITNAVKILRSKLGHMVKIEVETRNFDEVKEAVEAGADIIMLDNMNNEQMTECVKFIDGRAKTEASGNITLDNIASVAKTGVDIISLGALTHSVKAFDISMKMR
ncbi:MAG: carboxylating nicotinate-nucleotide diphosphorylase [Clostridia bacterium]|nr:carboxylating nicotinate-nucleotide diphosphorylase [Clostridia bacterium]MBR2954301.1 carboxylating nicotinate-nucleotide diphosphorylase [Clostridia bacterium]